MKKNYLTRVMTLFAIGLAALAVLLILFVNRTLADLAEWLIPGSAFWTHMALMGVEALGFTWLWLGVFGGKKHLLVMYDADAAHDGPDNGADEAGTRFAEEFRRRMRTNPHIRRLYAEAAKNPELPAPPAHDSPEYLAWCVERLNDKANAEIRQNAARVFLATALSQNGRLDALLVFVSLCRLVWRISAIYNQRPHPREILSLYRAVVTSTFLALSLEEMDIATEITVGFGEAFHAIAPLELTATLPVAGKAMQRVTTSTVDGAVNCYLCLRAGIVTRNAFAYRAVQEPVPSRAAVFREAGVVLLDMSAGLVEKLARTLGGVFKNATLRVGKDIAGGISHGVSASAGFIASGAAMTVHGTGNGISKAAGFIASPFRSRNNAANKAAPNPAVPDAAVPDPGAHAPAPKGPAPKDPAPKGLARKRSASKDRDPEETASNGPHRNDPVLEDPAGVIFEALDTYLREYPEEAARPMPTREGAEKRMEKAYAELLHIVEAYSAPE